MRNLIIILLFASIVFGGGNFEIVEGNLHFLAPDGTVLFLISGDGDITFDADSNMFWDDVNDILNIPSLDVNQIDANNANFLGTVTAVMFTDSTAILTGGSLTNVKLGSLTTNGFVRTFGGDGSLVIDSNTYLTELDSNSLFLRLDGGNAMSGTLDMASNTLDNVGQLNQNLGFTNIGDGTTNDDHLTTFTGLTNSSTIQWVQAIPEFVVRDADWTIFGSELKVRQDNATIATMVGQRGFQGSIISGTPVIYDIIGRTYTNAMRDVARISMEVDAIITGNVIDTSLHFYTRDNSVESEILSLGVSSATFVSDITIASGSITSVSGTINFGNETLSGSGNINFSGDLNIDGTTTLDETEIDGILKLDGITFNPVPGLNRGSSLQVAKSFITGTTTMTGFMFVNNLNQFVFNDASQGSSDDAGKFNIDFDTGAVLAAAGAFDIDSSGNITDVGSITGDGDFTTTANISGAKLTTTSGRIVNTARIDDGDSPYTVLVSDHEIFCDTDGGAITVNLLAGVDGTKLRIINTGSSGLDVTVAPNGAELLDGVNASKSFSGPVLILTYETTEGWW